MALAPRLLPCKKRRAAAEAPGPAPLAAAGRGSPMAERPAGPALPPPPGLPPAGAAQACGPSAGEEPGEASLRSGGRVAAQRSPEPGGSPQDAREAAPAAGSLPRGRDRGLPEEGKSPNLHTEVEAVLPGDPQTADNHSPKQVAQVRSSLQLPFKVSTINKSQKNTKTGEQLQQTEEETEDVGLFIPLEEQDGEEGERRKKRRKATKRKRDEKGQEEEASLACDIKLDDMLDRTLEDGAKQHNLTVVNVRNILHEVITNEHVVAMMKAAISETEDMPMFEPKMTRSKLKEVVEKGVVIPAWNISPIKKANEIKPPQFVDIPLEEDDSSDEEYQPEEEDEDETAEESLLESDVESSASSPRGAKRSRTRRSSDMIETDEEGVTLSEVEKISTPSIRHISAEVVPMGPPPPPKPKQSKDSTFMEKLHAVDEELASSPVCMDSYQSLDDSLIAFRTRSKRPLKDVPLGQLEAELRAPDITPDMYDPNTVEDEDWKRWLGGLMNDDVENEDEADDDDDPEYNFLEDLDEPDTEDFRNDRAVRITKKEVNELMEELFETFQDEMGFSNMEDEGPEDEDAVAESRPNFNTPQALRFEEPLANLLNEQHRTVKEQLEQLRIKKSSTKQPQEMERTKPQIEKPLQTLVLDIGQRKRLHQQMQQHVQLLSQIHLLTSSNPSLSSEASTTRMFLTELSNFAHSSMLLRQPFHPKFQTVFQPCNLKGALQLIEDFHAQVKVDWSPHKTVKKSANEFPCLPKQVAWILATRKVFMYPELLPICSLKAKAPQNKIIFTKAEDNLLALGLKHFEGTEFPKPLISKYLLPAKTAHQLTVRIKNLNMNRAPDNIIKYYKRTKQLPILFKCCEEIQPSEWKPPVEREEQHLPFWLKASLPSIQRELKQLAEDAGEAAGSPSAESALLRTGKDIMESQCDEKYPLLMPKGIVLTLKPLANRFSRRAWRRQGSAALKPLLIRPTPCLQPSANAINIQKAAVKLPQPDAPPSKVVVQIPQLIQPAAVLQAAPGMPHLNIPSAVGSGDCFEFQSVLSALQPDSQTSVPAAVPPAQVSSAPLTFQTKVLPALTASKIRKPCVRRGYQKRRGTKPAPLIKAAPLIQPAPVIFTVPAATVKVLSLSNGCNMIQPINTSVGRGTQTIPITTLLVNPTTFPCPLNQTLVSTSLPPLITSPNAVGLPASSLVEDKERLNPLASCRGVSDENSYPIAEPKEEPQELYASCSAISPKKEDSTGPATPDSDIQDKVKESDCCSWIVVETTKEKALEPLPLDLLPQLDLEETVKTEPTDPSDALEETHPTQEKKNLMSAEIKEEFILDLGQELDMEVPSEHPSEQKEIKKECTSPQEKGEEKGQDEEVPMQDEQQLENIDTAGMETSNESSKNASHSADVDAEFSSPFGKPEDSSSGDGQSVGTPAGPDAGGEKDGQEEEEEEDFDDFTQDEEDEEEMSSASEESVLSVPELQETMEKLTWLATERRLSQEGDSEEENSQEENSEPEEEEEEEGEGEGMEQSQKEDEMTDEIAEDVAEEPKSAFAFTNVAPEVESSRLPPDENAKVPGKTRNSQRARSKRGRARASKDTSKLLLLYDEEILERDPLREQKDLAFAQAYLNRVRDALRDVPGKYEDFLRVIYEFETSTHKPTAVDLYATLQTLLQEWPQLLTDFAAFLLPEQALECGLFEEQQAFDKSRKFLRQLEICFAENPTHHQKIIKVLQSCADCLPQDIAELKTQMWQLLKGHDHLQDEFSVFFDHLRPSASRMGDFEEISWTEEKEYEFDGFEEVSLPDVEEEEEAPKLHAASKNKKRKEIGGQNNDKEADWVEGAKECACSCHDGSSDPKLKKSKRRSCSHSSCKVCDSKCYKNKDSQELTTSLTQRELSPQPEGQEPAEESLECRDDAANGQSRTKPTSRRADALGSGSPLEGQLICRGTSEGALPKSRVPELSATPTPLGPPRDGVAARASPTGISDSAWTHGPGVHPKLPPHKSVPCAPGSERETSLKQRRGGTAEGSLGLAKQVSGADSAANTGVPGGSSRQTIALRFKSSASAGHPPATPGGREGARLAFPPEGKRSWVGPVRNLRLKTLDKSSHLPPEAAGSGCAGVSPSQESQRRLQSSSSDCRFEARPQPEELECGTGRGQREDEQQQKIMEATVCAKNSKVSSTGEKVVLWTREADRVILTTCQERGAHLDTFSAISQQLGNKTASEVSHRFRELMRLFHTSCDGSSEEEEDATSTSNTDQLSDKDLLLSEEEQDD